MQSSNSDLQSLAARVERLEKQYHWLKSEVVTEKFVLVDADGKTRATLCTSEGVPGLGLFDTNGNKRAFLRIGAEGPSFGLIDVDGKERLTLELIELPPRESQNLSPTASPARNCCCEIT